MTPPISELPTLMGLYILGALSHEGLHILIGYLGGGTPFVSRRVLFLPYEIDFETPEDMGDLSVRLTGGSVAIFPVIAIVGAYIRDWQIMMFGLGGIVISWYDLFAAKEPAAWKKFTAGEKISRDDID